MSLKNNLFAIVGVLIVAGMGAAAVMVPRAQSPRLEAEGEVNRHLERARRLLARYDTNLSVESSYREVFDEDVFGLSADRVEELLDDPDFDITGDATEELEKYTRLPEISGLPRDEQELLTRIYGPQNWRQHKRSTPPSRVSGSGMINKGSAEYQRRLSANSKLLADALQEISGALGVGRGDYSTRQHAAANRLKGMILYEQGLAISRSVLLMRSHLASRRFAIKRQAAEIALLKQDQDLVAASEIDARIDDAQADDSRMASAVEDQKAVISQLQVRVADLDQRVTSTVERSEAAREAMETLQEIGVDLSDPHGFSEFKKAFKEQAENYRRALADAHALRYGTLGNATIDETGDYIRGQYIPIDNDQEIEIQRGLEHFRHDLESAQAELEKMEDAAARLEESAEMLRELKRNLGQRVQLSSESVARREAQVESEYSEFIGLGERARQAEEEVIELFDKAMRAFKTAETGVVNEENRAREHRPDDPQRQPYHYSQVAGDQGWLRGQLLAQQADGELRIGLVLLGRYQDARASLSDLGMLDVGQDDLAVWRETAESAKTAAVERAESAIEILDNKAQDRIGEGNWTVAAEIGAAHFILSLLDVELAAERALEWYGAAVENREDLAREHVYMRNYIQNRTRQREQ